MAEGEVSLWIRVRDGFTAGFKAAAGATANFGKSVGDVARGASTSLGGELSRIWSGISDNLGRILGDVPGVRKVGQIVKQGQASIVGGAIAGAGAVLAMVDAISDRWIALNEEIQKTGIELAKKQEQISSKIASAKSAESFKAIDRDIVGEIAALNTKLVELRSGNKAAGFLGRAASTLTGMRGTERAQERTIENAIKELETKRAYAERLGVARSGADAKAESDKAANEITRNQQQAAQTMVEAARDIAMASNPDEGGALKAEADRLKGAITDLSERLKNGLVEWNDANRSALQGLVNDYKQTSISLIKFRDKEVKDAADAQFKAGREAAEKTRAMVVAAEKKAGEDRRAAMEEQGKALIGEARRRGGLAIDAAQGAADRANFRNRPETFKERLDAFIARREEKRAADKDDQKLKEREMKIREKLERGIGISKKDQQLLKDMAALRAGMKADAAAAAKKKQVEDAIINIEKKVESVLQASGGPN